MSENKIIENLISKISSEELNDSIFTANMEKAKKNVLKRVLRTKGRSFQIFSKLNILGIFAIFVLIVFAGSFYLNTSNRLDKESYLVFLDKTIGELGDGNEILDQDISENLIEEFYY